MAETAEIIVEKKGAAGLVTLNRPQALNALTLDMARALRRALDAWADDPRITRVVVTGAGERAFSAGGDIAGFAELEGTAAKREFQRDCMRTFAAVEESPLPVVAAVRGYALGGGCELAMA